MKNILSYSLTLFLFTQFSYAQLQAPVASPRAKISQKVGLIEIGLDYSRPSMKGREVFGGLVPFNKIWRTGANNPTTISFSGDVKINNQLISQGEYHIYTVPSESNLNLIIYEKTDAWGSLSQFDESLIKAKVNTEFNYVDISQETFTISIDNISNNGSTLNLMWENRSASYYIDVLTKDKMINNINKTISGNPTANDYRKAAVYYFEEDIDLNKAIKWIDIAFKDSDDLKYWQLNYKALIYEKAGKMKKAKEYAKVGLDKAKASNNPDGINVMNIVYKRLNKK